MENQSQNNPQLWDHSQACLVDSDSVDLRALFIKEFLLFALASARILSQEKWSQLPWFKAQWLKNVKAENVNNSTLRTLYFPLVIQHTSSFLEKGLSINGLASVRYQPFDFVQKLQSSLRLFLIYLNSQGFPLPVTLVIFWN